MSLSSSKTCPFFCISPRGWFWYPCPYLLSGADISHLNIGTRFFAITVNNTKNGSTYSSLHSLTRESTVPEFWFSSSSTTSSSDWVSEWYPSWWTVLSGWLVGEMHISFYLEWTVDHHACRWEERGLYTQEIMSLFVKNVFYVYNRHL